MWERRPHKVFLLQQNEHNLHVGVWFNLNTSKLVSSVRGYCILCHQADLCEFLHRQFTVLLLWLDMSSASLYVQSAVYKVYSIKKCVIEHARKGAVSASICTNGLSARTELGELTALPSNPRAGFRGGEEMDREREGREGMVWEMAPTVVSKSRRLWPSNSLFFNSIEENVCRFYCTVSKNFPSSWKTGP